MERQPKQRTSVRLRIVVPGARAAAEETSQDGRSLGGAAMWKSSFRRSSDVGRHLEQDAGKFARERDKKYISCGRLNANETEIRDSQEERG